MTSDLIKGGISSALGLLTYLAKSSSKFFWVYVCYWHWSSSESDDNDSDKSGKADYSSIFPSNISAKKSFIISFSLLLS